ncbi:MAG: chromate transporter [Alphaproteobacteria bacterium]|jgi:chromate transporter|nr:chromate transporter [Alphaproteobacteria bacterium]
MPVLAQLFWQFAFLSLMAIGGANSIIAEIHRQVVDVQHWLSAQQFAAVFALAQAAPGPNVLVVSLIGWEVAGLAGALVATVGMCGPSCVLAYLAYRGWARYGTRPWAVAIQAGLTPITVGLLFSTGLLLATGGDNAWAGVAIAGFTAAVVLKSRITPLWLLAGAALVGIAAGL